MAITDDGRAPADRIAQLEADLVNARQRLAELDHRIKNDLQLIASVFILQLRKLPEGVERSCLRGALDRINAVAAVHRRLEVGEDPAHFEASGLIRDVVEEIAGAAKRPDVRLELALAPVIIPSRQAGPLALIAGELMRNAMKHAFADRPGVVQVSFDSRDGEVELSVCDDGAGLGATGSPHGFGATLCGLLAQQLRGALEFSDAQPGVRAIVRFPETH